MSKKGFTLIELLVVVAVLALLASIVFSNLGGAREGARISNALAFQSQTHSLLGSDLVGWWNFNEGSGSVARDLSGYGNNGTIVGATRVAGVPGAGGTALNFNGSSNYVDVNDNSMNFVTNNNLRTVSFWINTETSRSEVVISGVSNIPDQASYNANININNGRIGIIYGQSSNSNQSVTSQTVNDGIWKHLVFVDKDFSGTSSSRYSIYVDGESATTQTSGLTAWVSNQIAIGRRYWSAEATYFTGMIDDVRFYSRALSASEIQTLYAQTKDRYLAEND